MTESTVGRERDPRLSDIVRTVRKRLVIRGNGARGTKKKLLDHPFRDGCINIFFLAIKDTTSAHGT